jgi:8-oxo-dGTP pyrophosphatase MutT (NUDIX family)
MQRRGPWIVHDSSEKFRNKFVAVTEDRVTEPDGGPGTYATVRLNPGIAVLAINDRGEVHLTRQFRYAIDSDSVEVVCGAVEAGEDVLEAAKRELREEVGIAAETWTDLGSIDMDTSILCCPVQLFVARGLRPIEKDPDPAERIQPLTVPLEEAVSMVHEGAITHAPSCVVILKAAATLKSPAAE